MDPVHHSPFARSAQTGRVGSGVARARGPFGQRITDHDAQTLELVAQLLESAAETAENNPLNANVAL